MTFELIILGLCFGLIPAPASAAEKGEPERARVLLLGDSISIGYTPFVRSMLQKEAVVIRPMRDEKNAENCAGTPADRMVRS